MNIVTEIINMIAPAALDRIAAALGLSGDATKKALGAAVPALLAALGTKAASPVGARALFDAVSDADPDVFGKLTSALTGAKSEKFVQGGMGALSSLLGDSALQGLTGAVAKQAGLGGEAGASLMAIAGQLAMGSLAKSAKSSGLDASGLAGLLSSQQGNIKAALPSGLGELLSSAGVAGSSFASQASRAAVDVGRTASTAASRVTPPAKSGTNWLMWSIPIALIAAGLWYFLGNRAPTTTTTTDTTTTAPAVTDMMLDGVDIGKQVTTVLDGLKTSLSGITDVATAQAALPKLQEAVSAIDGVSGMLGKLSAGQKSALAALVTAALPTIKDAATKVLAIQGVGDVAKPVVDSLLAKLEFFWRNQRKQEAGMAYTEDELNLLSTVPQLIGSAIASASGSGLFGTGKELFANANAILEGLKSYAGNTLIKQLLPDPKEDRAAAVEKMKKTRDWAMARLKAKGIDNAEKLRAQTLEDCAAAAILGAKASAAEAEEYRQWALSIAEKVANAATEGGFLGFGGERVTPAEKSLIDDIRRALGTNAAA